MMSSFFPMDSDARVPSNSFFPVVARLTKLCKSKYSPLAAANKTEFEKIVNGKMFCDNGETPEAIIGANKSSVEKGRARAMHIKALESAPPNPPE